MKRFYVKILLLTVLLSSMVLVSAATVEITSQPPDTFSIAIDQSEQMVKYEFTGIKSYSSASGIRFSLYSANNIDTCDIEGVKDGTKGITDISSISNDQQITDSDDLVSEHTSPDGVIEIDLIEKLEDTGLFTEFQEMEVWDNTDYAVNAGSDDAYICSTIHVYLFGYNSRADSGSGQSSLSVVRIYESNSQVPENIRLRESTNGTFNSMLPWIAGATVVILIIIWSRSLNKM